MNELTNLISKFAPLIGSAIISSNPISGILIALISSVFGADKNNPADIFQKINTDANAAQKLKQLEIEHENIILSNYTVDKNNARDREEKITEIMHKRDYVMEGIAIAVVIGYFGMCCLTVFYSIPLADHDMLNMLFGQLMGGFMMVLSYYFGSSNK